MFHNHTAQLERWNKNINLGSLLLLPLHVMDQARCLYRLPFQRFTFSLGVQHPFCLMICICIRLVVFFHCSFLSEFVSNFPRILQFYRLLYMHIQTLVTTQYAKFYQKTNFAFFFTYWDRKEGQFLENVLPAVFCTRTQISSACTQKANKSMGIEMMAEGNLIKRQFI